MYTKTISNIVHAESYGIYRLIIRSNSPKVVLFKNGSKIQSGEVLPNLRDLASLLSLETSNSEGVNLTTNELGFKIMKKIKEETQKNKNVIVLIADGFEEVEALTVVDYLRRVDGITVDLISTQDSLVVTGAHQIKVIADNNLDNIQSDLNYNAVVIPGGMPGATNLRDNKQVIDLIIEMNHNKKLVAAICAGPIVLQQANILTAKNVTSYPGFEEEFKDSNYVKEAVVVDDNIITSRGPSCAEDFALNIINELINKETKIKIEKDILKSEGDR